MFDAHSKSSISPRIVEGAPGFDRFTTGRVPAKRTLIANPSSLQLP